MDRDSLKKSHAATINKALFLNLNYLLRLRRRMEQVGFPPDDKLYLLVCKAYDARIGSWSNSRIELGESDGATIIKVRFFTNRPTGGTPRFIGRRGKLRLPRPSTRWIVAHRSSSAGPRFHAHDASRNPALSSGYIASQFPSRPPLLQPRPQAAPPSMLAEGAKAAIPKSKFRAMPVQREPYAFL